MPQSNNERGLAVRSGQVKDPACGMKTDAAKAASAGNTLNGDSRRCKENFSKQPEHYLALNPPQRRP